MESQQLEHPQKEIGWRNLCNLYMALDNRLNKKKLVTICSKWRLYIKKTYIYDKIIDPEQNYTSCKSSSDNDSEKLMIHLIQLLWFVTRDHEYSSYLIYVLNILYPFKVGPGETKAAKSMWEKIIFYQIILFSRKGWQQSKWSHAMKEPWCSSNLMYTLYW